MQWKLKQHNKLKVHHLMKALPCGRLLAEVLESRMAPGMPEKLLHEPMSLLENPYDIEGIKEVARAIIRGVRKHHVFYIYADYDVDGLTSGYIMYSFLQEIGAYDVSVHFPERHEGYGLNMNYCSEILAEQINEDPDHDVTLVTVDNGITKHEEINFLREHDVNVVVTDHHEMDEALGKPNVPVCDPKASTSKVGEHLCGAGVAWKICSVMEDILEREYDYPPIDRMTKYIPYVALGTVADVMPMVPENMALVNLGLCMINDRKSPLFSCFIEYLQKDYISAETFGWEIAPMLNACGRMGEIKTGAKLLFAEDHDDIMELLKEIDDLNYKRKKQQKDFVANVQKNPPADDAKIALFELDKKNGGIAGPVAGRVAEEYQRPAIIYHEAYDTDDEPVYKGSVRSIPGIDILSFLKAEQESGVIKQAGGHAGAAGITFYRSDEKMAKFIEDAKEALKDVKPVEPTIVLDSEVTFSDLTTSNMDELALIPYDKSTCPAPNFYMMDVQVEAKQPFKNKDHLVLNAKDKDGKKLTLVGWGMYPTYEKIGKPAKMNIAGTISTVGFNDFTTKRKKDDITFRIIDMKAS